MGVLLAGLCALGWGISDFAGGVASKKESQFTVTFSREFAEAILITIIAMFVHGHLAGHDVLLSMGCGLIAAVILPLFFKALSTGHMSVIAPICGVVGATVPVVGGLVAGEKLSGAQIVGVVIALASVALISLVSEEGEAGERSKVRFAEDVGIAALCGLGFGSYFVLIHHTTHGSGLMPNVVVSWTIVACLLPFGLLTKRRFIPKREVWAVNTVGASSDLVGFALYTVATRQGLLAITGVVSSLYPVVTAILALVFLKEPFRVMHKVGLGFAVLALALIGLG